MALQSVFQVGNYKMRFGEQLNEMKDCTALLDHPDDLRKGAA
jgi:hypothetical protein